MHWFRKIFHIDHLIIVIITAVLLIALAGIAASITFLNPVSRAIKDFSLSDLYYEMGRMTSAPPDTSQQIVIVDVTSLHDRADIAKALATVQQATPAAVGVDVFFPDYLSGGMGDDTLAEVAHSMERTVFINKLTDYNEADRSFKTCTHSFFGPEHEGYANLVSITPASCIRSFSYSRKYKDPENPAETQEIPSFATAVVAMYGGHTSESDHGTDFLIHYRHLDFRIIPVDSLAACTDLLRDRIVLIGNFDEEDNHFTPVGKMAGVKIHAYTIQTLIDHHHITKIETLAFLPLLLVIGYLTVLLQYVFTLFTPRRQTPMWTFISSSKFVLRLVVFAWLVVLAFIGYTVYNYADLYIPMGIVFVLVGFTGEARGIYSAIVKSYGKFHPNSFAARSLYFSL